MLSHVEPNIVFKLFQHDPDCASQTSIPIERRLKLLFLSVMYRLHVNSITRSLTGNYTSSCRNTTMAITNPKDKKNTTLTNAQRDFKTELKEERVRHKIYPLAMSLLKNCALPFP